MCIKIKYTSISLSFRYLPYYITFCTKLKHLILNKDLLHLDLILREFDIALINTKREEKINQISYRQNNCTYIIAPER